MQKPLPQQVDLEYKAMIELPSSIFEQVKDLSDHLQQQDLLYASLFALPNPLQDFVHATYVVPLDISYEVALDEPTLLAHGDQLDKTILPVANQDLFICQSNQFGFESVQPYLLDSLNRYAEGKYSHIQFAKGLEYVWVGSKHIEYDGYLLLMSCLGKNQHFGWLVRG